MTEAGRRFIGYDYRDVEAKPGRLSFLIDGYKSFGWQVDENISVSGGCADYAWSTGGKNILHLKRDRKIVNKTELTRLQGNFEACISEIDILEKAKSRRPFAAAAITALVGTVFMAGGVFAATVRPPQVILCMILAFPGFIGWIAPYFVYRKMLALQTRKIRPLIEKKYDEIYEICEKGNSLLY